MNYDQATAELIKRYHNIYIQKGTRPDWSYHKISSPSQPVHPPIPFIGKHYFDSPVKILLYASAENLRGYNGYLDEDSFAVNRHRFYFDQSIKDPNTFFPWVHIAPINNGALVLCAFHIMSQLTELKDMNPEDFLETITFGNYGKYTISPITGTRNVDYAAQPNKLAESQPYIEADFKILKPDYVIMVGTTYHGAGKQKEFVDRVRGTARIIPIYQITPTTVNSPNLFRKHGIAKIDDLHPTLAQWYLKFHAGAVSGKYFLSVFSYLDDVMKNIQ